MADDIRQRIIASVFSKRSASGALEEQYVAHIKIFEDATPGTDDAGKKARYILLALSLNGGLIHKSRMNTNGTFSIGKTWDLKELRALEVSGRTPGFDISFARRYRWQSESWEDQETFLIATVRLFRRIMGGQSPQLVGWRMPEVSTTSRSSASTSNDDVRSNRSNTPPLPNSGRRPGLNLGPGTMESPPRSTSPGRLTPRQIAAGFRSASPTGRSGMPKTTPGKGSFDQTLSPVNGRVSGGDRRTPSPGPGPSPISAYPSTASSGTERSYAQNRSPLVPRGDRIERSDSTPSNSRDAPPLQGPRAGRNRPPDLERTSFDRARDNGLPNTPRPTPGTAGMTRSERAPSPAGFSDVGLPRNPYPSSKSDRAVSPQPSTRSGISARNGVSPGPASARRPRAGSRSERAPSPALPVEAMPQRTPTNPRRELADTDYRRAPSPNPPPSNSLRSTQRSRGGSRDRAPSPSPAEPTAPLRPRAGSRGGRPDGYVSTRENGRDRSTERVVGAGSGSGSGPLVTSPLEIPNRKRSMDSGASPKATSRPRKKSDVADPRDRPPLPLALNQGVKKDPYARISFFDPANQAVADRLLANDKAAGEEESNEATIANIEEMLEGYEWTSISTGGSWGGDGKSAADQTEARLLKELTALDAANMYSFVEQDDRVETVLSFIDEALKELDEMDGAITSYKSHLNAVVDDISYIQGQNRGLQVQTQNQRGLLKELEDLLQTVNVDREALLMLTNQSLEKRSSLLRLEEAATELYKALIAGKDTDMAATMERLDEYRTYNTQFCQRVLGFLPMMISYQADLVLKGKPKEKKPDPLVISSHAPMEEHLAGYAGLVRYMKEMDETRYGKICGAYFGAASQLYKDQIKILLDAYIGMVRKASDEESEINFAPPASASALSRGATMRRAGTIVRSPLESRNKEKDKDKGKTGDLRGYEAFGRILDQICPLTYREEEFLSSFLQINETGETFADYMNLDSYFRRNAARWVGLSRETQKLLRGAMDLIFSFLPDGLKKWIDDVLDLDKLQMIGISAHLERYKSDAEERGNTFLARLLQKQQQRLAAYHSRQTDELIKSIEATKLSAKKRKGVVHYIKYFPVFVNRVEGQLTGADSFEIRTLVDTSYEKIVNAMFDSLQQTAKLEGEGEDKGQLNYHVILIENMYSFIGDLGQQSLGSVTSFSRRAEGIYEENLHAYTRLLIRRPFQKMMDFVDGAEKLLKTLSPADVSSNSSYNKSTLKKLIKDNSVKDVRRHVDTLFKRVEKHFSEGEEAGGGASGTNIAMPGTVFFAVWKACEDELIGLTERLLKIIATCHKESNLEYTVADVEAAFKKHRA